MRVKSPIKFETLRNAAIAICGLALSGCVNHNADATTTINQLSGHSKGAVVLIASFEGVPIDQCGEVEISMAKSGAGGQRIHRAALSRKSPNANYWPLEAGSYDVRSVFCIELFGKSHSAGLQIWPSFAKFSVAAGEVVNAGHLVIGGNPQYRTLAVTDLPQNTVAQLNRDYPNLAAKMTKRLMKVDVAVTNAEEKQLGEQYLRGRLGEQAANSLLSQEKTVPPGTAFFCNSFACYPY